MVVRSEDMQMKLNGSCLKFSMKKKKINLTHEEEGEKKKKVLSGSAQCISPSFNLMSISERLALLLPSFFVSQLISNFTPVLLDYLHLLNGFLIACRVLLLALLKFHLQ